MTLKEFLAERRQIQADAKAEGGWSPEDNKAMDDAQFHIETLLRIVEVQDVALERMDEANFNRRSSAAEARAQVEALLKRDKG